MALGAVGVDHVTVWKIKKKCFELFIMMFMRLLNNELYGNRKSSDLKIQEMKNNENSDKKITIFHQSEF
jgi:hypothetical protein